MENKEKNFISAVIYVHNAEYCINRFLEELIDVMEENFEYSEIICVNDASDDGSLDAIKDASSVAAKASVSVVNMSYFHGLESAMCAGVDMSIGDLVFEFDDTWLDFDPRFIIDVYQHALEGYDIVSASPDRKGRITARMFYRVFYRFSTSPYRMFTEKFRILSRRAINRVSSMNRAVLYRKAMYADCGLRTDNMRYPVEGSPSRTVDRKERKYRSGLAVDSLILYTEIGYRFSIMMTMLMMLTTILIATYTVVTYFTLHPVEGWTTTVLFLALCFFGLFAIQTVIVKYLQLLVNIVFKRKYYRFESIEKLTK